MVYAQAFVKVLNFAVVYAQAFVKVLNFAVVYAQAYVKVLNFAVVYSRAFVCFDDCKVRARDMLPVVDRSKSSHILLCLVLLKWSSFQACLVCTST